MSGLTDTQIAELNREYLPDLIYRARKADSAAQGCKREFYAELRGAAFRWREMARDAYWQIQEYE